VINQKLPILKILAIFVISEILAGPLRYYLPQAGFPELLYLFKALLLSGIFFYSAKTTLKSRKIQLSVIIFVYLFLFSGLYGIFTTGNFKQVGFGFWIFVPMIAGVVIGKELISEWPKWTSRIILFWAISIIGVLINVFVEYPWEGASFSLGEINLISARLWFGLGLKRLAGFGRSASVTSHMIFFLSLMLLGIEKRRRWLNLCVWLISLLAIILTTNKTTSVVMIIVGMLFFLWRYIPQFGRILVKVGVISIGLISQFLPIVAFLVYQRPQFTKYQTLFYSLFARFTWTWPRVFNLIIEQGNFITGLGVGGIGSAQRLYSPNLQNVTDSLFVYLFATFGLIACGVYSLLIISTFYNSLNTRSSFTIGLITLSIILIGVTNNIIESPISSIVLGVLLSNIFGAYNKQGDDKILRNV